MTQKKAIGWARLLGILTLLSLWGNWRSFAALGSLFQGLANPLAFGVALLVAGLGLVAGWALITDRLWGFWPFYLYAILGLILLSIVFVPSLPALFPPPLRLWIGILINGGVVLLGVWVQLALQKGASSG